MKIKVDQYIQDSKSNFKIKAKLEEEGFDENVIPTGKQLSNRRTYLIKVLLKELASNTEGGFYSWLEKNKNDFNKAGLHDMIVIDNKLIDNNFVLIVSSKALLQNALKESQEGVGFLALDSTHKLVNCQFKLTTITTASIEHEIADIGYVLHAHEDSQTFTYALGKLKDYIKKFLKVEWVIKVYFFLLLLIYLVFNE